MKTSEKYFSDYHKMVYLNKLPIKRNQAAPQSMKTIDKLINRGYAFLWGDSDTFHATLKGDTLLAKLKRDKEKNG